MREYQALSPEGQREFDKWTESKCLLWRALRDRTASILLGLMRR
jgi:hypothetical protein